MNKWEEKRLEEICEFLSRGITPKYSDNGILVLNQKCIRDNRVNLELGRFTDKATKISHNKLLKYGDILINSTGTGTLGRTAIYKGKNDCVTVDGHVTILRAKNKVSSIYLGYFLHSIELLIENFGRGSTNQKELSTGDLKRIRISLPGLPIQERIADILSAYDDLIEANNRRIEILEQAAQELYKEWFIRFRFPGHEKVNFENGLPEGWNIQRLSTYGRIETGKTPSMEKSENYGDNVMFIKTPDMHGNMFVIRSEEMLSECGHLTQPKKLLPPNSIMVTCIGSGGVVAINAKQAHTNQQINSIILKDLNKLEWLYFTCKSLKSTIELFGATGTTMTNLSKGKFEKLKVINPDDTLILKYHRIVAPMLEKIKLLMYKNQNLIAQRDLLLPSLMSGKLEV